MIGKQRDRLTFFERVAADDGYGNTEGAFEEQFSRKAEVVDEKGSEQVLAQRLAGVQPITFRVRADAETLTIDTGWVAEDRDGRRYNITAVARDDWRRWLTITATAGTAEG